MSVAKTIELSSSSPNSFEEAIREGISRAAKTLQHVEGAWIKEQNVLVHEGKIQEYKVRMMVTFILND
jgi:dodecin